MAVFAYLLTAHLGIVVDMFVLGKPLSLYLSGAYNPLANGGTAFGLFPLGKFFKRYGIDLYMYIYPIEQRPRNLAQVPLHLGRGAYHRCIRIIEITTG